MISAAILFLFVGVVLMTAAAGMVFGLPGFLAVLGAWFFMFAVAIARHEQEEGRL